MAYIQPQTFPIPVVMEDEMIHTEHHPFCFDSTCPCHEDNDLLASIHDLVLQGLLTQCEATRLIAGEVI